MRCISQWGPTLYGFSPVLRHRAEMVPPQTPALYIFFSSKHSCMKIRFLCNSRSNPNPRPLMTIPLRGFVIGVTGTFRGFSGFGFKYWPGFQNSLAKGRLLHKNNLDLAGCAESGLDFNCHSCLCARTHTPLPPKHAEPMHSHVFANDWFMNFGPLQQLWNVPQNIQSPFWHDDVL